MPLYEKLYNNRDSEVFTRKKNNIFTYRIPQLRACMNYLMGVYVAFCLHAGLFHVASSLTL